MKILHTSDWHLGKTLENVSRIDEQRQFIDELCSIVEAECIDLILIAGDIFDTYNPSSVAEELFYEAIDRLSGKGRRALVIIAGNHDSPDRLCASSPLAYKNGIILLGYPYSDAGIYKTNNDGIQIVDSGTGWLELKLGSCEHNAMILTLPYPSEARLEQLLSVEVNENSLQQAYSDKIRCILYNLSKNFREDTVNLVVGHIFLREGKISDSERQLGGAMLIDPEVLPEEAHYIALGHLHRPQRIKSAPVPAYYSGSPLAYSFSEVGYSKAVYIIDAVPGNTSSVREIQLNSGKPLEKWIAQNGYEEALKWCEEGRAANAWIDVEIHTDRIITAEEQKKLREINPGIINIRPVIKSQEIAQLEYRNRETKRIDELFKDYYKHKIGIEVSEEILEVFLDVINHEEETDKNIEETRGDGFETKIS